MLRVYGRKSSFNVQKVMWLVDEIGVAHEHVELGGSFGGLDEAAFRNMNPHGRVPVIDDNGVIVWESHAIMRYLAARHGSARFWVDDPAKRAKVDQWLDWSQTTLQPDFLNGIFWGFYRTPEHRRDEARVNAKIASVAKHMRLLDGTISGNAFLLGADLSLADIAIGTNFYRYFNLDIERPIVPNVVRWFETLKEREAYRRHVMIPFEDLYGRLDF